MKKFLTVLLALSVVFTYSFSSVGTAFATTYNDKDVAEKQIRDKAANYNEAVDVDYNKLMNGYSTLTFNDNTTLVSATISKEAYGNVLKENADAAKVALAQNLTEALVEFEAKIAAMTGDITGYDDSAEENNGTVVGFAGALGKIKDPEFAQKNDVKTNADFNHSLAKEEYSVALNKTIELVRNYDMSKFVTDDYDENNESSYDKAVKAQKAALVALNNAKLAATTYDAILAEINSEIYSVYKVTGVGTSDEAYTGTFYDAIKDLKTTSGLATDKAKIEYAKGRALSEVKKVIEAQRDAELKVQNDIIFKESIKDKPNQKVIDAANEKIEKINKKMDALLEVMTYRFDHVDFRVEKSGTNSYINAYYDNKVYKGLTNDSTVGIAFFTQDGSFGFMEPFEDYTYTKLTQTLSEAKAVEIVKDIAELKEEAAKLKEDISVDGDVAIDVDAALADAIETTYMTGTKGTLATDTVNTAVHARTHALLGEKCDGTKLNGKVTVDGKKYERVADWGTAGYSKKNAAKVKAIIKDAKAAIKAAKTVAEADTAFLDAYKAYDAVLTVADQNALFNYGNELYGLDTKAKAEIAGYAKYKVEVMGDDFAGNLTTMTNNLNNALLEEVNNAADLDAAVAEAKAFIDNLKTKDALKAENAALNKKIVEVKVPVTLDRKDEIVALYKEYTDFVEYADTIGYAVDKTAGTLVTGYVKSLAKLDAEAMDALVKAIEKDGKTTLDDRADVEALRAAADAYEALYIEDLGFEAKDLATVPTTKLENFEDKIFELDVDAAEDLIRALPSENATAAQLKAARDAVNALGYEGQCAIDPVLLTKLNRLEQNAAKEAIESVKAVKINATTKRYDGKKIRIAWTTKGDTSAIDGYRIYYSTKRTNTGYKYLAKTTKKYINHTSIKSSVKKGTRVYYKVRAYKDVDGKRIFSDYSNPANRLWK